MGTIAQTSQTYTLRLTQKTALWPELVVAPYLQAELEQWESDMAEDFAMSPSILKPKFKSGQHTQYYKDENKAFGNFVRNHQLEELVLLSDQVSNISQYVFRSIGIGQGHDLEGLVTAARLFGVKIKAYDWATSALENGRGVLTELLEQDSVTDVTPQNILERAELGQLLGLGAEEKDWPYMQGRLSIEDATQTILISLSRVLQHVCDKKTKAHFLQERRVVRILRGLGRIIALNPLCRVVIVHPYPEDELNQPIEKKYRTADPYTLSFFEQCISEGAGAECVELRRSTHEYMGWQLYSASTIGLQQQTP